MIGTTKEKLDQEIKKQGYIEVPFYAGSCLTCKDSIDGKPCEKEKFTKYKRKLNTKIIENMYCVNWNLHVTYLSKLARRPTNGKSKGNR